MADLAEETDDTGSVGRYRECTRPPGRQGGIGHLDKYGFDRSRRHSAW